MFLVTALGALHLPSSALRHQAAPWLTDDAQALGLARSVNQNLSGVGRESFSTGAELFDGEWVFGTSVMAAFGNAQLALAEPELRTELVPAVDRALHSTTSFEVRRFDRERWGADPLSQPNLAEAHVAYVGYLNLALSLRSALGPSEFDALNRELTERLVRQYARAPGLLLETYPGEYYPVDNAAAIASIALYHRVRELRSPSEGAQTERLIGQRSEQHEAAQRVLAQQVVRRWLAQCRSQFIDRQTGLLYQSLSPQELGHPHGALPRGSGTALAAYFISYADPELSAELHSAARRELLAPVLGFGVLKEYPASVPAKSRGGDIDSGPLIFGYSISASGFFVGSSRIQQDERSFAQLFATFSVLGGLASKRDLDGTTRQSFVSGGPLADAIMLSMLTAPPRAKLSAMLEAAARRPFTPVARTAPLGGV